MPRVKIDYIVSFSNEDPDHPASNLLSWEVGKRRWLCRPGEPSCSVVLQLKRSVQISAVHIGSYHAAVVEVLVGRSETPNDPFEVLVPSSVFLSPSESRREPQDRVRSFSGDQLATNSQRWDRVRIVCRQPYNKQCKYGISFIQIYEPESGPSAPKAPSPVPIPASRAIAASTNFGNTSSDEEDYCPGQLFAATRASAGTSNTESQIRQATSHILKNMPNTSTKIVKSPIVKNTNSFAKQNVAEPSSSRHRDSLMYTDDEEQPHSKIDSVMQRHNDVKAKEKEARDAKEKLLKEKKERGQLSEAQNKKDDRPKNNDDRTRKDDNKATNIDNSSRSEKNKKDKTDTSLRDDQTKYGHKNRDDREKRDDRSRYDLNRHKNRQSDSRTPGRGDNSNSRNRDKTTPSKGRNSSDDKKNVKRSRSNDGELCAGPVSSTPHTLLSHAWLVLSGYTHPQRGHIRAAACALGATVLPDWGPRATHLICAFPNTPKLRQALASNPSTPIATGEWVEKCCSMRRLLPWQWFATEPSKRVPMPDLDSLLSGHDDNAQEECDTDEEIEKVLREQKKRKRSSTPNPVNDSTSDVEFVKDERIKKRLTVHDSDSDGDKTVNATRLDSDDDDVMEGRNETATLNMDSDGDVTDPAPDRTSPPPKHDPLPNFFDGFTFYIEPDVGTAGFDINLLKRYVRAYGGVLVEEWSEEDGPVDYVVCVKSVSAGGRCVRADWVWRCHEERRLCEPGRYLIRPADV